MGDVQYRERYHGRGRYHDVFCGDTMVLMGGGYGVYSEECSVQCVFNVKKQYKQLFK